MGGLNPFYSPSRAMLVDGEKLAAMFRAGLEGKPNPYPDETFPAFAQAGQSLREVIGDDGLNEVLIWLDPEDEVN